MKLNSEILNLLSEKIGVDVTTHNGAALLCKEINSLRGQYVSINTIKRLVGLISYTSSPRLSTLNILAMYLGYNSWMELIENRKIASSGFEDNDLLIDLCRQRMGTALRLAWDPDRKIIILHKGEGVYEVKEAENSKLLSGDILHLSQVAEGFPFFVKEVIRDGKSLGPYNAAARNGLIEVSILE